MNGGLPPVLIHVLAQFIDKSRDFGMRRGLVGYALDINDDIPKTPGATVDLIDGYSLQVSEDGRSEFRLPLLPLLNVMDDGQKLYGTVPGFKIALLFSRPIETRHARLVLHGKGLLAL
jgi:hypothetical protein